jgi:transcriptional regulator with XRE-family HTH domain
MVIKLMANRLKELRKEKSLTQKELSLDIDMPITTIAQYERGDREPKLATWQALADYFGVSVPYLQGLNDKGWGSDISMNIDKQLQHTPLPETEKGAVLVAQSAQLATSMENDDTRQNDLSTLGEFVALLNDAEKAGKYSLVSEFMNQALSDLAKHHYWENADIHWDEKTGSWQE